MNFIKKIFDGKTDNLVHLQFQKFSRGEFRNRAEIQAKNSNGKFTINATADFANDLVRDVAEKLGNNKTEISGAVVSTSDMTGKINFKSKKQFQGVKNYAIQEEMTGNEIIKLLNEFPKTFFALSFKTHDSELKIKPKAPVSAKPKNKNADDKKEKKKKPDFCKLITTDKNLAESFVFESQNWKNAEISHTYFINEIKIPEHLKNESDFAKVREESVRKGKIVRDSNIDGQKMKKEKDFSA